MLKSNFLGDKSDFIVGKNGKISDSQHLSSKGVILYDTDFKLIQELYTYDGIDKSNRMDKPKTEVQNLLEDTFEKNRASRYANSLNKRN